MEKRVRVRISFSVALAFVTFTPLRARLATVDKLTTHGRLAFQEGV